MRFLTLSTLLFVLVSFAPAADWPQYRGPTRNDVSPETGLLQAWPAGGPKLLWTYADAGVGYSPPAVVDGRVYLTGGRGEREHLIALDAKTAKDGAVAEAWTVEIGPTFRFKSNSWSAGPSATPTVDGDSVYALGGNGDLVCVDTTNGKERWRINLPKDLGASVNPIGGGPQNLGWGFTGSPLVDGDSLVIAAGGKKGTLAALDKKTGKVLWRSVKLTDQAAYTSPMPLEVGGVRQYAILTNIGVAGVAAKDGTLLWQHKRPMPYGTEVINTPLIEGNLLYTTVAAGNGGCEVLRIEKDGDGFKATSVYANKNLMNHHGNVVLLNGRIFGYGQGWTCQDFKTGEIIWSDRAKLRGGSVTYADGRFYCYTEDDATAALIESNADGWKEHGRFKIPKASTMRQSQGKVWTPPVVSNGRLFLRDQELVFCYGVKGK